MFFLHAILPNLCKFIFVLLLTQVLIFVSTPPIFPEIVMESAWGNIYLVPAVAGFFLAIAINRVLDGIFTFLLYCGLVSIAIFVAQS